MSYYHILSLDGGGIRGIITTILLSRLEEACPGFLSKIDLVAGTSTGGILALALADGLPPAKIRTLYEEKGPLIFANSFWRKVRDLENLVGADYDNKPLAAAIREILGDKTLGDLEKRVLVSSFALDNRAAAPGAVRMWKAKFFENFPWEGSDSKEKLVDVALNTSAAPTYFPIHKGYIDGGVVANNPSMCALTQAIDKNTGKQSLDNLSLLSIGTGTFPNFLTAENSPWGLVQWAPHLISLMLEGNSGLADFQCREILDERYLRVNPTMPEPFGLDAISEIPVMVKMAETQDLTTAIQWVEKYYG